MPPSRARPLRRLLGLLLAVGCGRAAPPPAAPAPTPVPAPAAPTPEPAAPTPAPAAERRCLPIVSGCGCAYACALTMYRLADGAHEVTHDLQDSRLDRVVVARWCFDDAGRGSPAAAAGAAQTRCAEVFFDGTPCGGECVPRPDLLRCALTEGRCAAR